MLSKEDLENDTEYKDIKEDVRLECLTFGVVLNLIIPRTRDGFSPASEGFIFVEFQRPEMAQAAAVALHGRKFADKVVLVQFVSLFPSLFLLLMINIL